jgi:hypothetical protein
VLKKIHKGVWGNHSDSRMLAHKAMRAGYYWPTMNKDSVRLVQQCNKCQRFARVMKNPPEKLSPITSPWPFTKWGVDINGPMPQGKGRRKFLLVAVDYFTKWAKVEALATITTDNVTIFLWSSVICQFDIPHAFVTDNGKQFDCGPFRKWCAELQIRNYYIFHSDSSTSKWASGSYKQNTSQNTEEKARQEEGSLGRLCPQGTMGLSYDNTHSHWCYSIRFNFWFRGSHPCRSQITKLLGITLQSVTQ